MFGSVAFFFSDSSDSADSIVESRSRNRYGAKKRKLLLQNWSYTEGSRLYRRALRDAANFLELPEEQFIQSFRVNKQVFSLLLDEIAPRLPPTFRSTRVPIEVKLATFLSFIGTGVSTYNSEFSSIVSKSQVSRTMCELFEVFEQQLSTKWLMLDQTQEEEHLSKEYFHNISGIPGVVGCVDNVLIRIKTPDKDIKDLYNYRQAFTCLNVMVICDHNQVIRYVDASQPGSYNDSYVWEQSAADSYFKTNYENGKKDTWLVGDSAYKLSPYFMIPYSKPTEEYQKFFNEKLVIVSDIIKQCLNNLQNRFSCLSLAKGLCYTPEKAAKIFISCCILHNICIACKSNWVPVNNELDDGENTNDIEGNTEDNDECQESSSIRDELALQSYLDYKSSKNLPDIYNENEDNRLSLEDTTNLLDIADTKFLSTFGVNKKVFSMLLDEIIPKLKVTNGFTPPIKLAIFLEFIATGGHQITLEHIKISPISKSSILKIISEMLDIFEEYLFAKWIKFEENPDEEAKQHFYDATGLHDIIGCVDNIHIQIKTPDKEIKNLYFNSEGFYSLNVIMICDHNMIIKFLDSNQPGSCHDAYVWDQSSAKDYVTENTNIWLLGKCAYKMEPYIMTPFENPNEDHEHEFNQKHFEAQNIIKNCFSTLKARFKCLTANAGLQYTPEKASKIITACCILHNISLNYENSLLMHIEDNRLHLQNLRNAKNILDFPDIKFLRKFAINKNVFSALLDEIEPKLKTTYRITHTPAAIKLAAFLEFIATGAQQTTLGHEYTLKMSRSQVSKIINDMLDVFEEHLYGKWINLEQNTDEENEAKQHFYKATGIPGVVGCVDNIHIPIKTPAKEVKKLYFNRKGLYTLNVIMICDHNMVIKYVDSNQPGSYYDAYVWDQSSADSYFNTNYLAGKINTWLLGDCAYKLQPYLMIPFKNPNEDHEHKFNQKHFEARKIIKNCFDILKNRFKCLTAHTGLQYTPEKASKIITACCILHNICVAHKNYWQPCDFSLDEADDDDAEENIIESPNVECAKRIRNKLAKSLS